MSPVSPNNVIYFTRVDKYMPIKSILMLFKSSKICDKNMAKVLMKSTLSTITAITAFQCTGSSYSYQETYNICIQCSNEQQVYAKGKK